jgi:RecA-family ATPase
VNYNQFLETFPPTAFDPLKKFPPEQWIVEWLWLGGGKINGIFGTPKSGKSRFLGWMLAAMLGRRHPFAELRLGRVLPQRVLYLRGEESEEAITRRLKVYGSQFGVDINAWADHLMFMPAMNMSLERPTRREFLRQFIAGEGVDMIVADPYVRLHGADENNAAAMAPIHNELRKWTDDYKLDLMLVHHTGKLDETVAIDHDMNRWGRGTSDIAAILDTGILLHRYRDNEVKMFRGGRYEPQKKLVLLDHGDAKGWGIKPYYER